MSGGFSLDAMFEKDRSDPAFAPKKTLNADDTRSVLTSDTMDSNALRRTGGGPGKTKRTGKRSTKNHVSLGDSLEEMNNSARLEDLLEFDGPGGRRLSDAVQTVDSRKLGKGDGQLKSFHSSGTKLTSDRPRRRPGKHDSENALDF